MSEKLGGDFLKDIDKYVKFFRKINKNNQNIKIRTFGPNGFIFQKNKLLFKITSLIINLLLSAVLMKGFG